ncbi:REP element-mobilizing transposase RayT [Dysgonomonas alginatilytica]|uniref:REP element-mobilizing transposase RayT n=1 Tax=Dysgonomonas alginatilytica TaxID=1605892 RepID=A0A2V3PM39_9BACT|nr:transposase [Dysgonomonas alginatilytica]PXV61865.1 REP element-mobilizing transposase RayT [Dysgonomonas alginatilytica]
MSNNSHNRHSIRLEGYDYSSSGMYFITICIQNKLCLFGEVIDNEMILNDSGNMVMQIYNELPNKFADIQCHEIIIMPNHLHFIVENVGADLCVCPMDTNNDLGEHIGSPLHRIIQWFKTITTNHYINGVKKLGWKPFYKKIWQRNYYEHIIRNGKSYNNITNYIATNPTNWQSDDYYINQTHL